MRPPGEIKHRLIVGSLITLIAIYSASTLFYVATSADIGIRCLVNSESSDQGGIQIRQTAVGSAQPELPAVFGRAPIPGDLLLELNDYPTNSFATFSRAMASLRQHLQEEVSYDARVEGATPINILRYASLPSVIHYVGEKSRSSATNGQQADGKWHEAKYVRIRYLDVATNEEQLCWLMIKPLPQIEVVLSFLWCLLEFSILALAALAYSTRPTDQATRLFFILTLITLPAFVGGYHWWVIASTPLLTFPFVISAVLLPVITLHFFLSYPRESSFLKKRHPWRIGLLYFIPSLMLITVVSLLAISYSQFSSNPSQPFQDNIISALRLSIDGYIMVSLVYFGISVAVLLTNYRSCRQRIEKLQMQWILGAACLALPLILYTVYLAYVDRVGMALGRGRIPMVIVSLLFLGAYAIGMARYRLMLIDQILSHRMLYLVSSQAVTVVYSLLIAVGAVWAIYRGTNIPEQTFPLALIFAISILVLGRIRDLIQEAIDRRFFREKYRLDRAMHQMQAVVNRVADVRSLADHMLRSCREVLQVKFSALYLRDGRSRQFDLVSAVNAAQLPDNIALEEETISRLQEAGSCQRVSWEGRSQMPNVQKLHRDLASQYIHAFEVDGQLTGLVVLGSKASNHPYSAEDVTFVTAIGQMTGVALQCVRVQQNVSRLDNMLQEKTRKIETQDRQLSILRQQLDSIEKEPAEEKAESPVVQFERGDLIGRSPEIARVLGAAEKVAVSDTTVLIRGESGTGKELLAQAIHANSLRKEKQIVSVNCAALSPTLLESELFGHVKGAFTGAYRDTMGRFQMADQGTLFLDEIGDLPADVQVKLLRVLQERKFEPVGSRESISVDVRLIAATHQNLEQRIRDGLFRQDLYYRLNVISLTLPALRDRKEDIFDLSLTFLKQASEKAGKSIRDIDDQAFQALSNYNWPGNIRELQNAIHHAVVLADSDCILLENLPVDVRDAIHNEPSSIYSAISEPGSPEQQKSIAPQKSPIDSSRENRTRNEYELLRNALELCSGNKAQAARSLGMPRSTFYSKLKKHKLT